MPTPALTLAVLCSLAAACMAAPNGALPSGGLNVGYYETWSDNPVTDYRRMDLANIPAYVNVVILSFIQPDCTYTKGQTTWTGTGFNFQNPPSIVKPAIAQLKATRPNTRVLVSVGGAGASYGNFNAISQTCITNLVQDLDLDGVDLDFEPQGISCARNSSNLIACNTDAMSVYATTQLRTWFPRPTFILAVAGWHIGAYGEGPFYNSRPGVWSMTGVHLAMARSTAGKQVDLVSIMCYIVGNITTTGFDWREAYRAFKWLWPTQAIAIGSMVPPEDWPAPPNDHRITLEEVAERSLYAQNMSAGQGYGHMLWSLHLSTDCPGPEQIHQTVCRTYTMDTRLGFNCSEPLPWFAIPCNGSTVLPRVCSGTATDGRCGTFNNMCCPSPLCCSTYGWCGTTVDHCLVSSGCQTWAGVCTGVASPSPQVTPASPSPALKPSPSPALLPSPSPRLASPSPQLVPSPSPQLVPSPSPQLVPSPSPQQLVPSPSPQQLVPSPSPQLAPGPSPSPRLASPSPKLASPSPKLVSPSPKLASPSPKLASPSPKLASPSPKLASPSPKLASPSPKLASPSPRPPSPSPKLPSPSPKLVSSPSPAPNTCSGVSTSGACGPANGNLCCPNGGCCSFYGWCGSTSAHCYRGCQTSFGTCWAPDPACTTFRSDGRCGSAFGNACCPADNCCSQYGYCGTTTTHCSLASGCQPLAGTCTSP